MVTDLGYYDEAVVDALKASNLLYVEANHVSKENNYPDLALAAVKNEVADSLQIQVAPRDHAGLLMDL